MKKSTTLLLLFILAISIVRAQENETAGPERLNILKLNLSSLPMRNIFLQDEYVLNEKSSVALGISFLPSRSAFGDLSDEDDDIREMKFSGWSITPEYRYHFSKNAPKGFYIAPYFRYSHYSTNAFSYYSTDDLGIMDTLNFEAISYSNTSVGLMVGAQWKLGSHVVLDWWIFGFGFGSSTFNATAHGDFSFSDQDEFRSDIADIDLPFGDLKSSVNSTTATVEYTSPLSFRGFGLCLGYIF